MSSTHYFLYIICPAQHLVVEETNVLLDKGNAKLLSSLVNRTVVLATAGSGNVLNSRTGSAEDVIDERELQSYVSQVSTSDDFTPMNKLTKASLETLTLVSCFIQASRSSAVKAVGTSSKTASKASRSAPSLGSWPLTNKSMALLLSARLVPFFHLRLRTRSLKRIHQLSALSPASLVQWMRDCCPAPRPTT